MNNKRVEQDEVSKRVENQHSNDIDKADHWHKTLGIILEKRKK